MKQAAIIILILVPLALAGIHAAEDTGLPSYSRVYDPERDPFADSHEALKLARQTGRRVLLELGGNWCTYCKVLDAFIAGDRRVREALYDSFVLLKINVSEENMNQDFLDGLPETNGYPHFFVSTNEGSILYSKDTTRLLEGGRYSRERFLEFIRNWGPGTTAAANQRTGEMD